jgi:EmrB/QacA subfamily drug resistance transporter
VIAVATVVLLGTLMAGIDATAVNVALDGIAHDLNSSLATIQWIVIGYALAMAVVVPLTGWLCDRFGAPRVYVVATVVFLLGSALAAAAPSAGALIAARFVQGLGGGLLGPVGVVVITQAAGPKRLGRLMVFAGIPAIVGPVAGPVLGGWLVESASWRWIFTINLPVGAAMLVLSRGMLRRPMLTRECSLDWRGVLLLVPALLTLVLGLTAIAAAGGPLHAQVIVPVAVGSVLLALFVRRCLRVPYAIVDLLLFRIRAFRGATGTLFLSMFAAFGSLLLVPLYLEAVRGVSPITTGLLIAPAGIGAAVAIPPAGLAADRVGIGRIVPIGLLMNGAGFAILTQLQLHTSFWTLRAALFLIGGGLGVTIVPMVSGTMRLLRQDQVARATTLINIVQQAAAAFGTALLIGVLTTELGAPVARRLSSGSTHVALHGQVALDATAAFATAFAVSLAVILVALGVALAQLPREAPRTAAEEPAVAPA